MIGQNDSFQHELRRNSEIERNSEKVLKLLVPLETPFIGNAIRQPTTAAEERQKQRLEHEEA